MIPQDTDFLVTCLIASIESRAILGAKFEALFRFASQNAKSHPAWPGKVMETLLKTAVDWESPEILEDLLELAHHLGCVPNVNSKALAKACEKDNYDLVLPLVERGYRLKPPMLDKTMGVMKKRNIAQLILQGGNSIERLWN